MAQTKELGVTLNAKTSGFNRAMTRAASSVKKIGTAVAAAGAAATIAFGAKAIGAAMDYEQAMADVKAASGATGEEMAILDNKAKELGKSTKFMITDIAMAEKALAKTGYSAEQTSAAMDGVTAAAAASGEPLEQVARELTNVVKGYGLAADETSRVSDVFAEAARSSNTNIHRLAQGMREVGPVASEANIPLEKTTAMLGLLGDAGINASKAGRMLRASMIRFQKAQSGDITKDARESLDDLGIQTEKLTSGDISFEELISQMDEAGASAGDFAQIFGMRATPAMMKLANNINGSTNELEKFTEKLKESGGAARTMAETQLDTLSGQLTILKGSFNLLMTTIGQGALPILKNLTKNALIPMTNALTTAVEETDTFEGFLGNLAEQLRGMKQDWTLKLVPTIEFAEDLIEAIKSTDKLKNLKKVGFEHPVKMGLTLSGITWVAGSIALAIIGLLSSPIVLGAAGAGLGAKIYLDIQEVNQEEVRKDIEEKLEGQTWGIAPLSWDEFIATFPTWGEFISAFPGWGNKTWGIDVLSWDEFIATFPDWKGKVNLLKWDDFISSIDWNKWTTFEGWANIVSELSWSKFLNPVNWKEWIDWPGWDHFIDLTPTIHLKWENLNPWSSGGGPGGGPPGPGPPGGQFGGPATGLIPGYGGGDQIPALLERGEFIWPKEMVRSYPGIITGLWKRFQSGGSITSGTSTKRTNNFDIKIVASGREEGREAGRALREELESANFA